tara:strand:+ start:401 stop:826 length:426 start_codon:yes stop_codon:yes gene_type:complete
MEKLFLVAGLAVMAIGMITGDANAEDAVVSAIVETADSDAGIFLAVIKDGHSHYKKSGRLVGALKLDDGRPLFGVYEEIRSDRRLHFCATRYEGPDGVLISAKKGACVAVFEGEFMTMVNDPHQPVRFNVSNAEHTQLDSK